MEASFLEIFGNPVDEKLWHSVNYKSVWEDYQNSNGDIKFFISNGKFDMLTSVEHSRILANFLKEKNARFQYHEYKYIGHSWGGWAVALGHALAYIFNDNL